MPDASQSLLERITEALRSCGYRYDHDLALLSEAVMGVLGARDAEIRQHLTFEPGDCKCETCMQLAIDGALALLGDA